MFDLLADPAVLEAYACVEAKVLVEDLLASKLMITTGWLGCVGVINDINSLCQEGQYCMIVTEIYRNSTSGFLYSRFSQEQRETNDIGHFSSFTWYSTKKKDW